MVARAQDELYFALRNRERYPLLREPHQVRRVSLYIPARASLMGCSVIAISGVSFYDFMRL